MDKIVKIRNRSIGGDSQVFITAEIGVTCNYDFKITTDLIDVAHESGADAVKLIFWFPDELLSDRTITYTYETLEGTKTENMFNMCSKLKFTLDEWFQLKEYADSKDVILFSTVTTPSGIDYAEKIGLEAYKLSSWDFTNHPLWRDIAKIGKPMLIDTGPVTTLEVEKVMQIMRDANNYKSVLVHCYHTENYNEMNMRSIPYMQKAFNSIVGYSPAGRESEQDIMAVTLGAKFIEKRLTMDRSLPGHHHILSMEPDEFKDYVRMIRSIEASMGVENLIPSKNDLEEKKKFFSRIVANVDIPKNTVLTEKMLAGKRPANGVSPEYTKFFIGKRTRKDLKYNDPLSWEDV